MKSYNLTVVVVPDKHEDGREAFQAYCPDIEEAVTWGDTRAEALRRINELLPELVKLRLERDEPVPHADFESVVVNV